MATKRCQIGRNNPEMTGHRYLWQNTEIQNMASGWVSTNLANQRKQSTFNWQIRLRTWTWAKILRAGGWTAQVQPSTLPTDQPTISLPLHNQLLLKRIKQRERRIHLRTLMSSQELLLHGVWETIRQGFCCLWEKNFPEPFHLSWSTLADWSVPGIRTDPMTDCMIDPMFDPMIGRSFELAYLQGLWACFASL